MDLRHFSRSRKAIVTTMVTTAFAAVAAVGFASAALAADIVGTEGFDTLIGTEDADTIDGLGGVDYIFGRGGNDLLVGNRAVDSLFGEAGDDVLDGGDGVDYLFGGDGADTLRGGNGADTLIGVGDGIPDVLDGGEGVDSAWAGPEDVRGAGIEHWYVDQTPPCRRSAPAESPAGCNTLPDGALYAPTTPSLITGYAVDRDVAGEIDVHLYQTPPGGSAQFLTALRTNPPDEFVRVGPPVNFTFTHALPPGTTVEAFAINVDPAGAPTGVNPSLGAVVVP